MSEVQTAGAEESQAFLLAEFSALREEIVKRTEIQHQLMSLALIAVLAYPILAFFLAAAWVHNDIQIARLGTYIGQRLEPQLLGHRGGWESVWAATPDTIERLGSLAHLASRGVFLGSQIAMLIASLLTYRLNDGDKPLFRLQTLRAGGLTPEAQGAVLLALVNAAAIMLTLYILRRRTSTLKEKMEWSGAAGRRAEKESLTDR